MFHSICSDCCVSLKFLYEKLHYKNHVSVSVTKLPFRFTACLNKMVHILLHRNIFCSTFASFSAEFLFHSNVLLSLMFQYILSKDNHGIYFSFDIIKLHGTDNSVSFLGLNGAPRCCVTIQGDFNRTMRH